MAYNTQNTIFGQNSAWDARSSAYKYPNPFCDIASMYIPTNINDAMEYMEFLFLTMPPFMSVVNRVVSYFLTDIEISDVPDDIRDKYTELFDDELHMIQKLQDIGKDYFCFGGDTPVVTRQGVYKIRDLDGWAVEVLCVDGQWREAKFRSYGRQRTREIRFGRKTSVWATDHHHWWVDKGDSGANLSYVETRDLKKWYKIPVKEVPRPERNGTYLKGVMHGIVLGLRDHPHGYEMEFVDRFERETGVKAEDWMHELPGEDAEASYWYGVFSGMSAVAGYFQPKMKYFFLTHKDKAKLEACKAGFEFAGFRVKSLATRRIWNGEERYYLPFHCENLNDYDFLCEDHQAKFLEIAETMRDRPLYTGISYIGKKTRVEEVYCCEEPETHSFTLGGGVVTANCYGNAFVSLYLPFDRYLQCPECGNQVHISRVEYEFNASTGEFMLECPKCRHGKVAFNRIDRRLRDPSKVNVIRWNPKRIKLKVHPISGEIKYYYKLEPKFVEHIRRGDPFYLNTAQWGFVETCIGARDKKRDSTEYLFEFGPNQIYHMRDTVFAGLSDKIRGWAIPPLLPYFKLAYYIQLMRRYDESIAMDFIMPFRILYPQGQGPGGQDALTMVSMQTFIAAMSSMVEKKRQNMTSIEVSPFAIGYELIGGEAKQLAPKESIQQAEQELLNAMGFPQELFAGTLTLQAAPVALRLFEREWNPFVDGENAILQWMSDQIARYFMWDKAKVRLTPITLADDMEKKGIQMQAAAGQDISKQTAYRSIGIDYLKEQERIIQEQTDVQKMQEKAMAEAQAEQANGALGGGGQGEGGGGGDQSGMNGPGGQVGATPGSILEQAQELARNLVAANNPTQSRRTLAAIEQTNPTLYAMVKQQMQDLRQELSSQGREQMIAQMGQGG